MSKQTNQSQSRGQNQNVATKEEKLQKTMEGLSRTVQVKLDEYLENGQLSLPPNYAPENAIKSAFLILAETEDKNKKPVLESCSRESIANSLMDMLIQGLNPAKKQCYFIAYDGKLECQRSYFGTKAILKRIMNVRDIDSQIVYKGDEFDFEIKAGRQVVTKHKPSLANLQGGEILAAYCVISFNDDRPDYYEIMTFDQIKKAWAQGKAYGKGSDGAHEKFPDQMAKKTVENRACKSYINSSDDASLELVRKAFNRTEQRGTEERVQAAIASNANKEEIDLEPGESINSETGEVTQEQEPEPENHEPESKKETEKRNAAGEFIWEIDNKKQTGDQSKKKNEEIPF